MAKPCARSAFMVPFAELSVASTCSGNRILSPRREAARRSLSWGQSAAILLAAAMLAGGVGATAQAPSLAPNWYQQSPANNPGPRFESSIAYDATHGQVVLFSGNDAPNDTWLWNGFNWTQAFPATSPPQRFNPAMVYDAAHAQVVMFGGSTDGLTRLGDTWLWNGTNWTEASTTGPTPRNGSAMVYDAATSQVVLFGGVDSTGFDQNDTWVWNGTTWTNVTPASPAPSPSARSDHSMVYDAALGEVVLFGGSSSGIYLNDTWVWNGTTWTNVTPSSSADSPTARDAQGMAYDAALGQVVMFGGSNGSYLNDTWVWSGANWTQVSSLANPQARIAPNAMTYDAADGQVVLYSGLSPLTDTWVWEGPGNFGNVNVCPSNQTTPAPCSNTLTLTYNVSTTTTFGTPQALTQGTVGLDFTLASGGTCTGAVSPGNTCTVSVKFAPQAPGLRRGAVELFDSTGNLLTSTPIYGNGQGPVTAFGLGTQTSVNAGNSPYVSNGVAVDAASDLFVAETEGITTNVGQVVKVAANGTQTIVGSGLEYPQGLAVDGAGNLYIADNNRNEVYKVTPGNVQTTVGSGLVAQLGVAVDGQGDVFIGDYTGNQVVEVPANGGPQTVVYSQGSSSNPVGLAVDAAGDLFIADAGLKEVVEIPAGCASSTCQTTIGSNWEAPQSVVVDAAGDAFVADSSLEEVVEVPAGCTNINCQFAVASGIMSHGATVDAAGNIFIANLEANQVVKLNRSQPPSLNFPTSTNAGSRDTTDGASLVTLQNVGNTTLSFPIPSSGNNPSIGPDFSLFSNGQGDCPLTTSSSSLPGTLSAGDLCVYSVTFAPMTAGSLNESLVLTDNNLNAISPSAAASQSIALSGVGVATNFTLAASTAGSGSGTLSGTNCSTGSYPPGTTVTCAAKPVSGSQFTGWSGACSGSGSCSFSLSSNSTVIANFSTAYTLTVTEVGTGSGSVTDGSQITCSIANESVTGTCAGSYSTGVSVMLTANAAAANSTFAGWGGACASAGASPTCNCAGESGGECDCHIQSPKLRKRKCVPGGTIEPGTMQSDPDAYLHYGCEHEPWRDPGGHARRNGPRFRTGRRWHLYRIHSCRQLLHGECYLHTARPRVATWRGAPL